MRLMSVPRLTTCPCGRRLDATLLLFLRTCRRARRPAALPSRSGRASGAPCTWADTATSAYADAPKGKCGWPPRPSRSVWRPAVHPAWRGPSRFWVCEGEGSVERVRQRCVPRETARPCGRSAPAEGSAIPDSRSGRLRKPSDSSSPGASGSSGPRSLPRRTVRERFVGLHADLLSRHREWRSGEGGISARPRISLVS